MRKYHYKTLKYALGLFFLAFGRYPVSWLLSSKKNFPSPKKLKTKERYWITCDTGNTFHVEFDGPKGVQTIVFVHGLNSSSSQWYYQRLFFRNNYRLLFIDLPGHGQSLTPKSLSIATLASDLKTILNYFQITSPIVYGHSMGAMIAMEYCRQNQNDLKLKGMILQHITYTNAFKTSKFAALFRVVQKPLLIPFFNFVKRHSRFFHLLHRINYLSGLGSLYHRYIFFTGRQTPQQLRFISDIISNCPPKVAMEGMLAAMKFEIGDFLPQITIPTLIIGAYNDRITRYKASVYIHNRIKGSQLKSMKEGHMSLIENPQEVNQTVLTFLKQLY